MPFGLCNAPATFQILYWPDSSGPIVDDVIVIGRSFTEHLQNLQAVFNG